MNDAKQKVEVSIIGKHYLVNCPQQEQEKLAEAVDFLNEKVEELRQKMHGIKVGTTYDRDSLLAVIALNLSYELIKMNTMVSSKSLAAEKLVKQIKSSFAQLELESDYTTQKSFEMSL